VSRNPDLADQALPGASIVLSGQVNNFANPVFELTGGAGTFSGGAASYVLDLGRIVQGTASVQSSLRVRNNVTGPADFVDGTFAFTGSLVVGLSGFDAFVGLGAGDATGPMLVTLDTGGVGLGAFSRHVVLSAIGHNASGYSAAFSDIQLTVVGEIAAVPEPETYLQLLAGLGVLGLLLRRRARARRSDLG
jgi:hypothetical protein